MRRPTTRVDYTRRILKVLNYIQEHLDDAMTPHDLARVAGFSPHHFHRVFRGMVAESVMGHIRRLRLERSASWLKFGDKSVTSIAFDSGYETHESYTRAFRSLFGSPPSEFRASKRPMTTPVCPSGVHYSPEALEEFERAPVPPTPGDLRAEIRQLPSQRVAYRHHIGPYEQVGVAWDELTNWAAAAGVLGPGARFIGLCHDDPDITAADKIRYDACVSIAEGVNVSGEIGIKEIPAGDYAVARHMGPYDQLCATYLALFGSWLPDVGREPVGTSCVEEYFNDPEGTPAEELETEVAVLLR